MPTKNRQTQRVISQDKPDRRGGDESASVPDRSQSVGSVARRGVRSSIVAQGFTQLGSLAATVLLARLLTPADFGIVALTQSLLGAAALLSLSGTNAALVTRRSQVSIASASYFWLALVLGLAGVGVFAVMAGPITRLLGQPDAAPYLIVLSFSFAFGLLALVPNAMLQRSLRFGWMNASILAGAGAYFASEVVLAFAGWGAWAVIAGQVLGAAVTLVVSAVGARWRPSLRFSLSLLRADLAVTGGVGLGHAFSYVQKNADYWAVSRIIGGQPWAPTTSHTSCPTSFDSASLLPYVR